MGSGSSVKGGGRPVTEWIRLAPATALPEGESVRVNMDDKSIALFHLEDGFYAIDDGCLHMEGPLSEGWVDGRVVTCPWHAWKYDLSTGERVDRRGSPTRVYPVEVRDGWIMLGV
jgi:nitrite reductase/ring-hydroxylating ferredoxin subunit